MQAGGRGTSLIRGPGIAGSQGQYSYVPYMKRSVVAMDINRDPVREAILQHYATNGVSPSAIFASRGLQYSATTEQSARSYSAMMGQLRDHGKANVLSLDFEYMIRSKEPTQVAMLAAQLYSGQAGTGGLSYRNQDLQQTIINPGDTELSRMEQLLDKSKTVGIAGLDEVDRMELLQLAHYGEMHQQGLVSRTKSLITIDMAKSGTFTKHVTGNNLNQILTNAEHGVQLLRSAPNKEHVKQLLGGMLDTHKDATLMAYNWGQAEHQVLQGLWGDQLTQIISGRPILDPLDIFRNVPRKVVWGDKRPPRTITGARKLEVLDQLHNPRYRPGMAHRAAYDVESLVSVSSQVFPNINSNIKTVSKIEKLSGALASHTGTPYTFKPDITPGQMLMFQGGLPRDLQKYSFAVSLDSDLQSVLADPSKIINSGAVSRTPIPKNGVLRYEGLFNTTVMVKEEGKEVKKVLYGAVLKQVNAAGAEGRYSFIVGESDNVVQSIISHMGVSHKVNPTLARQIEQHMNYDRARRRYLKLSDFGEGMGGGYSLANRMYRTAHAEGIYRKNQQGLAKAAGAKRAPSVKFNEEQLRMALGYVKSAASIKEYEADRVVRRFKVNGIEQALIGATPEQIRDYQILRTRLHSEAVAFNRIREVLRGMFPGFEKAGNYDLSRHANYAFTKIWRDITDEPFGNRKLSSELSQFLINTMGTGVHLPNMSGGVSWVDASDPARLRSSLLSRVKDIPISEQVQYLDLTGEKLFTQARRGMNQYLYGMAKAPDAKQIRRNTKQTYRTLKKRWEMEVLGNHGLGIGDRAESAAEIINKLATSEVGYLKLKHPWGSEDYNIPAPRFGVNHMVNQNVSELVAGAREISAEIAKGGIGKTGKLGRGFVLDPVIAEFLKQRGSNVDLAPLLREVVGNLTTGGVGAEALGVQFSLGERNGRQALFLNMFSPRNQDRAIQQIERGMTGAPGEQRLFAQIELPVLQNGTIRVGNMQLLNQQFLTIGANGRLEMTSAEELALRGLGRRGQAIRSLFSTGHYGPREVELAARRGMREVLNEMATEGLRVGDTNLLEALGADRTSGDLFRSHAISIRRALPLVAGNLGVSQEQIKRFGLGRAEDIQFWQLTSSQKVQAHMQIIQLAKQQLGINLYASNKAAHVVKGLLMDTSPGAFTPGGVLSSHVRPNVEQALNYIRMDHSADKINQGAWLSGRGELMRNPLLATETGYVPEPGGLNVRIGYMTHDQLEAYYKAKGITGASQAIYPFEDMGLVHPELLGHYNTTYTRQIRVPIGEDINWSNGMKSQIDALMAGEISEIGLSPLQVIGRRKGGELRFESQEAGRITSAKVIDEHLVLGLEEQLTAYNGTKFALAGGMKLTAHAAVPELLRDLGVDIVLNPKLSSPLNGATANELMSYLTYVIRRLPKDQQKAAMQAMADGMSKALPARRAIVDVGHEIPRLIASAIRQYDNVPALGIDEYIGALRAGHTAVKKQFPLVEAFEPVESRVINGVTINYLKAVGEMRRANISSDFTKSMATMEFMMSYGIDPRHGTVKVDYEDINAIRAAYGPHSAIYKWARDDFQHFRDMGLSIGGGGLGTTTIQREIGGMATAVRNIMENYTPGDQDLVMHMEPGGSVAHDITKMAPVPRGIIEMGRTTAGMSLSPLRTTEMGGPAVYYLKLPEPMKVNVGSGKLTTISHIPMVPIRTVSVPGAEQQFREIQQKQARVITAMQAAGWNSAEAIQSNMKDGANPIFRKAVEAGGGRYTTEMPLSDIQPYLTESFHRENIRTAAENYFGEIAEQFAGSRGMYRQLAEGVRKPALRFKAGGVPYLFSSPDLVKGKDLSEIQNMVNKGQFVPTRSILISEAAANQVGITEETVGKELYARLTDLRVRQDDQLGAIWASHSTSLSVRPPAFGPHAEVAVNMKIVKDTRTVDQNVVLAKGLMLLSDDLRAHQKDDFDGDMITAELMRHGRFVQEEGKGLRWIVDTQKTMETMDKIGREIYADNQKLEIVDDLFKAKTDFEKNTKRLSGGILGWNNMVTNGSFHVNEAPIMEIIQKASKELIEQTDPTVRALINVNQLVKESIERINEGRSQKLQGLDHDLLTRGFQSWEQVAIDLHKHMGTGSGKQSSEAIEDAQKALAILSGYPSAVQDIARGKLQGIGQVQKYMRITGAMKDEEISSFGQELQRLMNIIPGGIDDHRIRYGRSRNPTILQIYNDLKTSDSTSPNERISEHMGAFHGVEESEQLIAGSREKFDNTIRQRLTVDNIAGNIIRRQGTNGISVAPLGMGEIGYHPITKGEQMIKPIANIFEKFDAGKSFMAGAGLVGGIWLASQFFKPGPQPEGNMGQQGATPNDNGQFPELPTGPSEPTVRVQHQGDSRYEQASIRIQGNLSNADHNQVNQAITQYLASQGMPTNTRITISDNSDRIDRRWVKDIVHRSVTKGLAF